MHQGMVIAGRETVTFQFDKSTTSRRSVTIELDPPGRDTGDVMLQGFDLAYTGSHQFGFGNLGIGFAVGGDCAWVRCDVALRDDHTNKREWQGTVTALLLYYDWE